MARNHNTNRNGSSWTQTEIAAVWQKGRCVSGHDPAVYRKDTCGAWMKFHDHGITSSQHGWEIDHIIPVSKGGTDDLSNLQPLQWENNRHKADDLQWNCKVGG